MIHLQLHSSHVIEKCSNTSMLIGLSGTMERNVVLSKVGIYGEEGNKAPENDYGKDRITGDWGN